MDEQDLLARAARTVFDLTSDAVVVVSAVEDQVKAVAVNQAFTESTGWTRDEVVGRTARDLYPPEIAEETEKRLREVLRRCEPASYDVVREMPAGRRHYQVTLWPLLGPGGRCVYLVSTTRDLTELRETQRAVERLEQQADIGSWLYDLEADRTHWSPRLHEIFGIDPAEQPPDLDGFLKLIHPEDRERIEHQIREAIARGSSFEHHHRIVRPDGETRYVEGTGEATIDEQGEPLRLSGVARDRTRANHDALERLSALRHVPGAEDAVEAAADSLSPVDRLAWVLRPREELEGLSPVAWAAQGRTRERLTALG